MSAEIVQALNRIELLLASRLDALLPTAKAPDWSAICYRWERQQALGLSIGALKPIHLVSKIRLADLKNIDDQKALVVANTKQFVGGQPCNNVLLTGSRGTGKSSLIKACLHDYARKGLRLIEVDKDDLVDLARIVEQVAQRPERFIIYCDDLSFEDGEPGYKALKTALDGSIAAQSDNVVIYATSNRRHLIPEYMSENLEAKHQEDGEIHHGDTVEEKISLSERFGLWINFYPFPQDDYLSIVNHWLGTFGCSPEQCESARGDALRFALERGSRSGRVAWQFAKDWAGSRALKVAVKNSAKGSSKDSLRGSSKDSPKKSVQKSAQKVAQKVAHDLVQESGKSKDNAKRTH
jgi:uncharacterized protein